MPRTRKGSNAVDEVLIAGASFGCGDDRGRLTVFVRQGERRRADDPIVARTRDQWHRDGEASEWQQARSAALNAQREREDEASAARQKKHAPERAQIMGWRMRGFGAGRGGF